MGEVSPVAGIQDPTTLPATDGCCLPRHQQTRNLVIFSINVGLIYLASPVIYVGIVQAALCDRLGASDTQANLPAAAYMLGSAVPILVAWFLPYVSVLKRVVVGAFIINALVSGTVAAVLIMPVPAQIKIWSLVVQGGVMGGAVLTGMAFMWEVLGRGVDESRRGVTLSLAFGLGPVLAVIGSLTSQLLLAGRLGAIDLLGIRLGPIEIPGMEYPANFVALFAGTVPIMALAALLAGLFVVPMPALELKRQDFLTGVLGGFWDFFKNRTLRRVAVVAILVYAGNQVLSNMTLYTREAFGEAPDQSAGYQNALRFGFKCAAGLLLGWLLTRTNPRAGVLVTAMLALCAVAWALCVSGRWYLLSFGLFGAGELFGVYAPNYILCCSAPGKMRRNMGLAALLLIPAAPAGAFFGRISDIVAENHAKDFAFRMSFVAALAMIGCGIGLAVLLPARPKVEEE